MTRGILWLTTASLALLATAAQADTSQGTTYGRVEGGYTFGFESEVSDVPSSDVDLDGNWTAGAALGYYFLDDIRGEVAFGYHENDADSASNGFGVDGDLNAITLMTNVYKDFRLTPKLRPFVGAGVGAARLDPDFRLENIVIGFGPADEQWKFAWNATAGVAFDISEDLSVETRYRYLDAGDYDFGPGAEGDYQNHAVLAGLTLKLGGRAPEPASAPAAAPIRQAPQPVAPAPAPAPEPVQPVELINMVYFDFNSAALTQEANEVLDETAAVITGRKINRLKLEGHTDTSGNADYNMGLARRRAEAVRAGLIARGVPGDAIALAALGESDPRVATGDGVMNQSNRFVKIIAVYE